MGAWESGLACLVRPRANDGSDRLLNPYVDRRRDWSSGSLGTYAGCASARMSVYCTVEYSVIRRTIREFVSQSGRPDLDLFLEVVEALGSPPAEFGRGP